MIYLSSTHVFAGSLALCLLAPVAGAHADDTLYTFSGGNDGGTPYCGLISGGKGNDPAKMRLYGTTQDGGKSGYGTVFEIEGAGLESVVYSFGGGSDGANPVASLITDANGNLYGTTENGGDGFGVVFKLTPGGTETVLHAFAGGNDGAFPEASLTIDKAGNLYGTTRQGGTNDLGVVFKVAAGGGESVLHSFAGGDGAYPVANLILDAKGNLYGTTSEGGKTGLGTVFKLAPGGSETVLHAFAGEPDGEFPVAGVIMDKKQNLYGTTNGGGANDVGTVFKLTPKGKEMVLHSFAGGSDGAYPASGVTEAGSSLFGTTMLGGTGGNGTVFKTPLKAGSDTVIYSFTGGSDGGLPQGGLLDMGGDLFGTTEAGGNDGCFNGSGCGVVFEVMQ
jgi:uncharacterized repeat protein (TIGR03803 family)